MDFLFYNNESDKMYEVEVMLGVLDESHIIRAIEYWDIERRRFPNKDHRAVIVAEEITNRFFNVIALMNKAIPIIAIQLNTIKLDDKIILNFTKVLDIYENPEDEENIGGEEMGRPFWENKATPKSIQIMDEIIRIAGTLYSNPKVTYNKHHVALGTSRINFMWLNPRKSTVICHLVMKFDKNMMNEVKTRFDEMGISYTLRDEDRLAMSIQPSDLKNNMEKFTELMRSSIDYFS